MNWYTTDTRPTLWGTLCEMANVSRAIWRDYRDCARAARRRARRSRHDARRYFTTPSTGRGWRSDWALIGLVAFVAIVAAVVVFGSNMLPAFEVLP